jgi:hypothetical protein
MAREPHLRAAIISGSCRADRPSVSGLVAMPSTSAAYDVVEPEAAEAFGVRASSPRRASDQAQIQADAVGSMVRYQ